MIRGGVAKRTWLAGRPYPFAGLTLRVRAAEERGARPPVALECVDEVEELDVEERCWAISVDEGERLRSCLVVGRRGISSSPWEAGDGDEKGVRWRIGVRIELIMSARRVRHMRMP